MVSPRPQLEPGGSLCLCRGKDGFFKPFVLLFLLSLPDIPVAWSDVLCEDLGHCVQTSWGGAAVVNAALGTTLPTNRTESDQVPCREYLFWAVFLLCSPFGDKIMSMQPRSEPACFRTTYAYMICFLFHSLAYPGSSLTATGLSEESIAFAILAEASRPQA